MALVPVSSMKFMEAKLLNRIPQSETCSSVLACFATILGCDPALDPIIDPMVIYHELNRDGEYCDLQGVFAKVWPQVFMPFIRVSEYHDDFAPSEVNNFELDCFPAIKPTGTLTIVLGKDPRGGNFKHACVACEGWILHDPHPSLAGIASHPEWIIITPVIHHNFFEESEIYRRMLNHDEPLYPVQETLAQGTGGVDYVRKARKRS